MMVVYPKRSATTLRPRLKLRSLCGFPACFSFIHIELLHNSNHHKVLYIVRKSSCNPSGLALPYEQTLVDGGVEEISRENTKWGGSRQRAGLNGKKSIGEIVDKS